MGRMSPVICSNESCLVRRPFQLAQLMEETRLKAGPASHDRYFPILFFLGENDVIMGLQHSLNHHICGQLTCFYNV